MTFKPPCELIANRILPALRAATVRALVTKYGMRQTEVSELFGITQAAVSQYATQTRGMDAELITIFPEIEEYAARTAAGIAKGEIAPHEVSLCGPCREIREKKEFCASHRSFSRLPLDCNMCNSH